MVRSMGRGQFHVTSAWDGYATLGGSETEEVIVPSEMEEEPDLTELLEEAPTEPEPPDESPVALLSGTVPALSALPKDVLSPPEPIPPPEAAPPIVVAAEGPSEAEVTQAPRMPPAPAEPPVESRTLVGLLARMWLLRATDGANGATAIAGPGLVSVDSTKAPVPPPPVPQPPAAPSPPSGLPTIPPERSTLLPPDVDDGRPLGGLATFLIELAEVAHPSPPPVPPVNGGVRTRVVVRLVHCTSHLPERLVSRDSCHQPRVGR